MHHDDSTAAAPFIVNSSSKPGSFSIQLDQAESLGDQKEQKPQILSRLSDYHFSHESLPKKKDCAKKYLLMSLAAGGGLAYWGAVDEYNSNHNFSKLEENSNLIGVTVSAGLFLLQSVDLAKTLLEDLSGVVPEKLKDILEVPPESQRKKVLRRTMVGSSIAGVPFLIIALANPLPPIEDMDDDLGHAIADSSAGAYFYVVNVGLHILPVAILQAPQFWYYRPLPSLPSCFRSPSDLLSQEIQKLEEEIKSLYAVPRQLIQGRITSSLDQLVTAETATSWGSSTSLSKLDKVFNLQGLERLIYLIDTYPPPALADSSVAPGWGNYFWRFFGAQLQLGAGFTWWTNVFPALYQSLKKTSLSVGAIYALTGIVGFFPSYCLVVILAFFGELQTPVLVNYLRNAGLKLLGKNPDFRLLPHEALLNPALWGVFTLLNFYITAFSSVNSKSVAEAQYGEYFPETAMTVLNIYADIGISILTFMALMTFYYTYQKECSAVFGTPGSSSQRLAHLLYIVGNLPKDIGRSTPKALIDELKGMPGDKVKKLLGEDRAWLTQHESKISTKEADLEAKKEERDASFSSQPYSPPLEQYGSLQQGTPPASSLISQCLSSLFCCFSKCRRPKSEISQPLLPRL